MSELKDFKCPNCGGRLEFDTKSQKLKCPYCEGTFSADVFDEEDHIAIDSETWEDDNIAVYTCRSCGGEIMADRDTAATTCPYCNNPVVMTSNVSGIYKPKRVIPFKYDKKQAKQKFREHLQGKVLLPSQFKDEATIDDIKGLYVPYWLFNGVASARIWYNATRSRHYIQGDYNVTETSYYKLFRSGGVSFADVPVDASSKIDDEMSESVEPYNVAEAKPFSDSYLAGYLADRYDMGIEETRQKANNRIANSTMALFSSTTGMYDTCIPSSSNVRISEGKQEYVMYPMWLLNVKYHGKMYSFGMNGQTGKFVGDLPADTGKLVLISLAVFIGVFILLCLIQYMML